MFKFYKYSNATLNDMEYFGISFSRLIKMRTYSVMIVVFNKVYLFEWRRG